MCDPEAKLPPANPARYGFGMLQPDGDLQVRYRLKKTQRELWLCDLTVYNYKIEAFCYMHINAIYSMLYSLSASIYYLTCFYMQYLIKKETQSEPDLFLFFSFILWEIPSWSFVALKSPSLKNTVCLNIFTPFPCLDTNHAAQWRSEFDTQWLFSHSSAEGGTFLCPHLKEVCVREDFIALQVV